MKKGLPATLLILVCAFSAALAPKTGAQAHLQAQTESLRVATMPLEPFVIADGDQLSGFSIDLWDAIAERLGMHYQ
jgi:ABC-type amino acid transport substrate-binding protein